MKMDHNFREVIMDEDLTKLREAARERLEALKGENLLKMEASTISQLIYELAMIKAELHALNPRGPLPTLEAP